MIIVKFVSETCNVLQEHRLHLLVIRMIIIGAFRVVRMMIVGDATTWSVILMTQELSFTIVICLKYKPQVSLRKSAFQVSTIPYIFQQSQASENTQTAHCYSPLALFQLSSYVTSHCLAVVPHSGAKENFYFIVTNITLNSNCEAQRPSQHYKNCRGLCLKPKLMYRK